MESIYRLALAKSTCNRLRFFLNPRLIDYFKITREVFPESQICLFTDGLLLAKWGNKVENNIWEAVKEYQIEVRVTYYPIPIKFDEVKEQLKKYDIPCYMTPPEWGKGARVWFFSEIGALEYQGVKHSVKHPFDLTGSQDAFRFISCYQFNESIVLKNGRTIISSIASIQCSTSHLSCLWISKLLFSFNISETGRA